MRGRKPKPTFLRLLQGNPGHRPLNVDEPQPAGDLADPPLWFTPEQRLIWDQCIRDAPEGLLRRLDATVLVTFVVAASLHAEAARSITEFGTVVKMGGRQFARSPYVSVLNQAAATMLKAASELGFSPSSRSRVNVTKRRKPNAFAKLREMKID